MVVVAHPDDELLGLGATMHKLINEQQIQVRVIILSEGITSRSEVKSTKTWEEELKIHRQNVDEVRKAIGYESVGIYDFPDNRFGYCCLVRYYKSNRKREKIISSRNNFHTSWR